MMVKKQSSKPGTSKNKENTVTVKPLSQNLVQRLEVDSWRSEIQQIVRTRGMSWASCFYLSGSPAGKGSEVTLCRIGFYEDERPMKPSYANHEIRIYYPYQAYQDILALITHSRKLYVEFKERPNGEIDAYISNYDQAPGVKKHKK